MDLFHSVWTLASVVVCVNRARSLEETGSANVNMSDVLSHHGLAVYPVSKIDHVVDVSGTGPPPTQNDFDDVVDGTGVCRDHLSLFLALGCDRDYRRQTCGVVVVLDPSPPAPLCASAPHCGYLFRG